jgi:hypothetical protein
MNLVGILYVGGTARNTLRIHFVKPLERPIMYFGGTTIHNLLEFLGELIR